MDAATAQKAFEAANQIQTTNDPALSLERLRESDDALFRYDEKDMMQLLKDKPWKQKCGRRGGRPGWPGAPALADVRRPLAAGWRQQRALLQARQNLGGGAGEDGADAGNGPARATWFGGH